MHTKSNRDLGRLNGFQSLFLLILLAPFLIYFFVVTSPLLAGTVIDQWRDKYRRPI